MEYLLNSPEMLDDKNSDLCPLKWIWKLYGYFHSLANDKIGHNWVQIDLLLGTL